MSQRKQPKPSRECPFNLLQVLGCFGGDRKEHSNSSNDGLSPSRFLLDEADLNFDFMTKQEDIQQEPPKHHFDQYNYTLQTTGELTDVQYHTNLLLSDNFTSSNDKISNPEELKKIEGFSEQDFSCPRDFEDKMNVEGETDRSEYEMISPSISKASKKIYKQSFIMGEKKIKAGDKSNKEETSKGKRSPWQPYEDSKLLELVKMLGKKWSQIASEIGGRTGKQVRDRYLNVLRPDRKKGNWTQHEDDLLLSLYQELGNKWSKIALQLPGRTEGQVKNRFHAYFKKKLRKNEHVEAEQSDFKLEANSFLASYNQKELVKPSYEENVHQPTQSIESNNSVKFQPRFQPNYFNNPGYQNFSAFGNQFMKNFMAIQHSNIIMNNTLQNINQTPDPTDVITFEDTQKSESECLNKDYAPQYFERILNFDNQTNNSILWPSHQNYCDNL